MRSLSPMLFATVANLANLAATAALVWTVVEERVAGRVPLVSLGRRWFAWAGTTAGTVVTALAAGVLLVVAPLAIQAAARGPAAASDPDGAAAGVFAGIVATVAVKLALVAFEEVAFRGALLDQLRERIGGPQAVLGSAVLFGLAHAARAGDSASDLVVAVTFVDAIGYGIAALATRSLWTPLAWHASKNLAVWLLTGSSTLQFAPGLVTLGSGATTVTDVAMAALVVAVAAPLVWLLARHENTKTHETYS